MASNNYFQSFPSPFFLAAYFAKSSIYLVLIDLIASSTLRRKINVIIRSLSTYYFSISNSPLEISKASVADLTSSVLVSAYSVFSHIYWCNFSVTSSVAPHCLFYSSRTNLINLTSSVTSYLNDLTRWSHFSWFFVVWVLRTSTYLSSMSWECSSLKST